MTQSSSYAISPWLTCYHSQPDAKLRLFCFPHGGGGPQIYRDWGKGLPDDIEVFALNFPGRGSRRKEAPITAMDELAAAIIDALRNYLDKPFAFFGHSVGALICFEVARQMRNEGLSMPIRVCVSAHKAPHDSQEEAAMYRLPDDELLEAIRKLGLVPDDALENDELVEFILPPLKADFQVSETYQYVKDLPLPVPLTALGGREDHIVSAQDLQAWEAYTSDDFTISMYEGDHFYTETQQQALLDQLAALLRKDLETLPRSIMQGKEEAYPEQCLHEIFREQAAKTPNKIAVADIHQQLTFRELDQKTDLLAQYLQKQGVVVDSIVGMYMESCVEFVIAYISILKAGGAYMPLEIAYPEDLLQRVLKTAQPVVVLTKSHLFTNLPQDWQDSDQALQMDTGWEEQLEHLNLPPLDEERELPTPDSLAYCVMTSGTTGEPKGIICPHRGAVNSYFWRYRYYPYQDGEREACNIFLVWEVIRSILQGYPSYLIPDDVIYDPWKLVNFLSEHRITRVLFTPSLLEQVFNTPGLDLAQKLSDLRIVWLNGEVVPTALRNRFFERLPHVQLLNDYSISECHDVCTHDLAELDPSISPKYAPLGFPMSNVRIYLLDEQLRPVPRGMTAEIYIGGDSLARGYLNEPQKTAERFIRDPLRDDGSRLFRTGDLGMILPNGQLEVKGRVEFMIKLRGYSIVLGAVETAIIEHPAVNTAVVITKDSKETGQPEALAAYIVKNDDIDDLSLEKELRRHLKGRLPHYAIPSYFIAIPELPLHDVTGKLDRKKLPQPEEVVRQAARRTAQTPPTTELHQQIMATWGDVLHVNAADVDDNFFDLGGHSLLAIRACDTLSQRLGLEVSVIDVYEHPTVNMLAEYLSPKLAAAEKTASQTSSARVENPAPAASQASSTISSNDLAIIGVACRFPGADTAEQFWENVCNGVCSIRELSEEELQAKGIPPEVYNDEDYRKIGALLDDVEQFEPTFWGLSKKEAAIMDPQHRLFLECCWHALEHAGYAPSKDGERTGVFGGCYSPSYLLQYLNGGGMMDPTDPTEFHLTETGNDKDYLATRVSYLLNLQGPSITVQTSCSTAASVVASACQALLANQCDMAVAGASSITFPQAGYQYVEGHISSRDGAIRTFDAEASGTILGDGVGVVVMKRLPDALEAGDNILAVVKGFCVNNDGNAKAGYSAPSVRGQKAMVTEAQKMAGVTPESVSYIEAHGTGTLIGDPIEVRALTDIFRQTTDKKGFCALGSVKPNIGHSNIAAGMAGLIKTALSLHHKKLAPTINFRTPNPAMNVEESPFYVNTTLKDWTPPRGFPRRAGVSCLGIGGTNCHFVLEEAPPVPEKPQIERAHYLLTLSAKTPQSLEQSRREMLRYLQIHPDVNLGDLEYTLHVGRDLFRHRLAVPCHDLDSAMHALENSEGSGVQAERQKVVFMFPGQGSQHQRMGYGLYESEPTFRRHFDECCDLLQPLIGVDLRTLVYAPEGSPEAKKAFDYAYYLQSAIFSLQYALARTLMDWGVKPDALAGHSIGEYTAACISGVLSLKDALTLIATRGFAMEEAGEGAMLSASMSEQEARAFVEQSENLSLAVINSAADMVLSGPVEAIEQAEKALQEAGTACRRVHVARAFHSPMMNAAAEKLTQAAQKITLHPPQIPMVSNITGAWLTEQDALDSQYWSKHARQTVRFADNVRTLLEDKPGVMVEVGSHKILSKLLNKFTDDTAQEDKPLVLSCLRHPRDTKTPDIEAFGQTLAALWTAGVEFDWPAFHAGEQHLRVPLPTYPFTRQSCWKDNRSQQRTGLMPQYQAVEPAKTVKTAAAGKISDIAQRGYIPSWTRSHAPAALQSSEPLRWLIFMDARPEKEDSLGALLARRLEQRGDTVLRVFPSLNPSQAGPNGAYFLNPAQADEYHALLEQLAFEHRYPQRIVSLWSLTGSDPDQARDLAGTYYRCLYLAQALATQSCLDPAHVWLVTDKTVQVNQEEVLPIKATMFGPSLVLPQENPQITCRLLDVQLPAENAPLTLPELAEQILAECGAAQVDKEPVLALRGQNRWVQRYEPVNIAPVPLNGADRLRQQGVYIITGGLGRIAGVLANRFARINAKLVLTDIVDFPGRQRWERLAADPQTEPKLQQTITRLMQLEKDGAEIMIMRTNMSKAEEVKHLLLATVGRFGAIDGIFHAAGVAHLKYLPEMSYDISELEFAPKIYGLLNLEQAINTCAQRTGHKPDFVFLFSSLASILGGLSMTAYTAANRFMDSFVQSAPRKHGVAWICANWDDWDFEYTKEQVGAYEQTTAQFAMSPLEGVETLERILAYPGAVQVLVATRPLQPRVEQWLHQQIEESDVSAAAPQASVKPQSQTRPAAQPESLRGSAKQSESDDQLEGRILEIFRDVLETPSMTTEENFFDVGGDSLLASQILLKLRRSLKKQGESLKLSHIFDYPTVLDLAGWLKQGNAPQPAEAQSTQAVSSAQSPAPAPAVPPAASDNGMEEKILAVFRDVLETPDMTSEENFFEAGGDSLLASQILLKLRRSLKEQGKALSLSSIFDYPTVRELSAWLTTTEASA